LCHERKKSSNSIKFQSGDLFAFHAVLQAEVDLLADGLRQPRYFAFSRHKVYFFGFICLYLALPGFTGMEWWTRLRMASAVARLWRDKSARQAWWRGWGDVGAGRQSAKDKWGIPVLVPSRSDSTVACPLLTFDILAAKAVLSTGKREKMRAGARY
jgi:hypothetical protein